MPIPLPELPEDNTGICVVIPNSPQWRQIYLGALVLLQQWWYYDVANEEDAEDVVQRVMQCAYLTGIDGFDNCMDICAQILECINTNEEIQRAIAQFAGISNITSSTSENATNLAGELLNNPMGCDNDIIYGMTKQLVEFSDRLIRDLIEKVKASQEASDNLGFLIGAIPVVETLPIDEGFQLAAKIAESMESQYLSASTELLRTEVACELFCLAVNNDCVLTLEMVRDYFEQKAEIEFDYTDPLAFFGDFITGTFVANAVYYGMNIFFFQIFAFGGKFLEFLFEDYLRIINAMYNDPDPDWETECDECITTWSHTFDFTVDDGGWVARNIWGTGNCAVYSSGNGWSTQDRHNGVTEYSRLIAIERTFTPDTVITNVEFIYDASAFTYGAGLGTMLGLSINTFLDGASQVSYTQALQACQAGTDILRGNPEDATGDMLRLFLRCSDFATATYQNSALITSCTVTGEGTNPFI